MIWLWRLNSFSSVYLSGSQFQSWGPTTLHIFYVFIFNAPNKDHQLISRKIHDLRASDKRDTPNLQRSGTPGLELRITGLPKQPNLLFVPNAELSCLEKKKKKKLTQILFSILRISNRFQFLNKKRKKKEKKRNERTILFKPCHFSSLFYVFTFSTNNISMNFKKISISFILQFF